MSAVGAIADRAEQPAIVRIRRVAVGDKGQDDRERSLHGQGRRLRTHHAAVLSKDVVNEGVVVAPTITRRDARSGSHSRGMGAAVQARAQALAERPGDAAGRHADPRLGSDARRHSGRNLIPHQHPSPSRILRASMTGAKRIGMGAIELRTRRSRGCGRRTAAARWRVSGAKAENAVLREQIETLQKRVAAPGTERRKRNVVRAPTPSSLTAGRHHLPEAEPTTTKRPKK